MHGEFTCKIHQVGDVFFTIVGVNNDPALKVDLVAIANQAANSKGTVVDRFSIFETRAKQQIGRVMQYNWTKRLGLSDTERLDIVFIDRRSHTLVTREYESRDGRAFPKELVVLSPPHKRVDPVALGQWDVAEQKRLSTPSLNSLRGAPFLVAYVQAQIDYETYRLNTLHIMPRVGGDVCVLEISDGKAYWVKDHQGKCKNILP